VVFLHNLVFPCLLCYCVNLFGYYQSDICCAGRTSDGIIYLLTVLCRIVRVTTTFILVAYYYYYYFIIIIISLRCKLLSRLRYQYTGLLYGGNLLTCRKLNYRTVYLSFFRYNDNHFWQMINRWLYTVRYWRLFLIDKMSAGGMVLLCYGGFVLIACILFIIWTYDHSAFCLLSVA